MSASSRLAHEQTILRITSPLIHVYTALTKCCWTLISLIYDLIVCLAHSLNCSFPLSFVHYKPGKPKTSTRAACIYVCAWGSWWDLNELELEFLRVEPVAFGRRMTLLGCASISNSNRYKCLRFDLLVQRLKHYFLTLYIFSNNSDRAIFYLQFSLIESIF